MTRQVRPDRTVMLVIALIVAMLSSVSPAAAEEDRPPTGDPAEPAPVDEPVRDATPVDVGARTVTPAAGESAAAPGGAFYVQFAAPLDESGYRDLTAAGVTFARAIPPSTYLVRLAPGAAGAVASHADFVGFEPVTRNDKQTPALRSGDVPPHARSTAGQVVGTVEFFADVALVDALAAADAAGVTVPDRSAFLFSNRLAIEGSVLAIESLAANPAVLAVAEAPPPGAPDNRAAQIVNGSFSLQTLGLNGAGEKIGIWEDNQALTSHSDLVGRATNVQGTGISSHATHVAGTIVGNGSGNLFAEGMAPAASLWVYDWNGPNEDVPTELLSAAANPGIDISNHSWGISAGRDTSPNTSCAQGWCTEAAFGLYDSQAPLWDLVVRETGQLVVKSAGNERNDCGFQSADADNCDGFLAADGEYYDNIATVGTAKNVITVGAVNDPITTITDFSSAGPADDGRIKPDVVANGFELVSTWDRSAPCVDQNYCAISGTSMAAPVVSGILAQLEPAYRALHGGADMPADTAKALLVNSATDLGRAGPDYLYGFGSVNAASAYLHLLGGRDKNGSVVDGETERHLVDVPTSTSSLQVTLNWIDPPGTANSAAGDLVNNLDIVLVDPNGGLHYPFTGPGRGNPTGLATATGPNPIDTVEQVRVASPMAGRWTIRVSGTNVPDVSDGPQRYALVSSAPFFTNDTFAAADTIRGPISMATGTNVGYSAEAGEPVPTCGDGSASNTAWWRWDAETTGLVDIDTFGSGFNTTLAVYTGTSVNALTQVACSDNAPGTTLSRVSFVGAAGTSYFIQVDGAFGGTGDIVLNNSGNDTFAAAKTIGGPPATATGNNVSFTVQPGEPTPTCSSNPATKTAWWNWTAPADGIVTIDTAGTEFYTVLGIYTGTSVDALTQVGCANGLGLPTRLNFDATAGVTYRIQVFGWLGGSRNVVLNISPPCGTGNNDFACARTIDTNGFDSVSNVGFGPEPNEPDPQCDGDSPTGPTAWWRWTSTNNDRIIIDTFGSDLDTVLAVYTGTTLESLTEVACNDNFGSTPGVVESSVEFRAEAGTTYYIQVDGWARQVGTIALYVTGCPPENDDFGCADPIGELPATVTGSNEGFWFEEDEPVMSCDPFHGDRRNTAWWSWVATDDRGVTIDTFGTDFQAMLGVFTGASLGELSEVACSNQGGFDRASVTFATTPGETYYIQVDGDAYIDVGDIVLNLQRPPVPKLKVEVLAVPEGDSGSGLWPVRVSLSAAQVVPVSVDWTTIDDPTHPRIAHPGSDYVAASGTIVIPPGRTEGSANIEILGDTVDEPPLIYGEWVLVQLSNPSLGSIDTSQFYGLGIMVILDDDPPPTITPGVAGVIEGNTGTRILRVPVTLSNPSADPVTVDWATLDNGEPGVATADVDYVAASGRVTFAPGETTQTVPITVKGDLADEPDYFLGEWILISFTNPSPNSSLFRGFYGLGIGIIVDDD